MKLGCCSPPFEDQDGAATSAQQALEAGIRFVPFPHDFAEELEPRSVTTWGGNIPDSSPSSNVPFKTQGLGLVLGEKLNQSQNDMLRAARFAREQEKDASTGVVAGAVLAGEDGPSEAKAPSLPSQSLRSGYLFRALRMSELDLVPELTSFDGCEELLRAAPLSTVLGKQGRVFSRSAGSAATYAMSHQVENIDAFISHNWDIPRWIKFLALSHHFTFSTASSVCILFWGVTALMQAFGWLPTIVDQSFDYETGFVCRFLHTPIFALTLFFAQDLQKAVGRWGPNVFLDKLCIHQVDHNLQQRGITKLSAFLCCSDQMISLYTNIYLEKLWTVFEVAAFLALRPVKNMLVLPLELVRFYYVGILLGWLACWSPIVIHLFLSLAGFEVVLWTVIFGGFVMYVCRRWAHSRRDVYHRLQEFSVKNCRCTVERDRQLVCRNIAVLMRAKIADQRTSDEEALEMFDDLVRKELPTVFSASLAPISVPWYQVSMWSFLWQGSYFVDVNCAMYAQGASAAEAFITAIPRLWWILIGIPLLFAIMEWIAAKQRHLQGVWDLLYVVPCFWLLVGLPGFTVDTLLRRAADRVDAIGTAVCAVVVLTTGPLVWYIFSHGRRLGSNDPEENEPLPEEYANYKQQVYEQFGARSNSSLHQQYSSRSNSSLGLGLAACSSDQSFHTLSSRPGSPTGPGKLPVAPGTGGSRLGLARSGAGGGGGGGHGCGGGRVAGPAPAEGQGLQPALPSIMSVGDGEWESDTTADVEGEGEGEEGSRAMLAVVVEREENEQQHVGTERDEGDGDIDKTCDSCDQQDQNSNTTRGTMSKASI